MVRRSSRADKPQTTSSASRNLGGPAEEGSKTLSVTSPLWYNPPVYLVYVGLLAPFHISECLTRPESSSVSLRLVSSEINRKAFRVSPIWNLDDLANRADPCKDLMHGHLSADLRSGRWPRWSGDVRRRWWRPSVSPYDSNDIEDEEWRAGISRPGVSTGRRRRILARKRRRRCEQLEENDATLDREMWSRRRRGVGATR